MIVRHRPRLWYRPKHEETSDRTSPFLLGETVITGGLIRLPGNT